MDCTNFIGLIQNINKFTPDEFASLFVDYLINNQNCINFNEVISNIKINYYDYYVSIMFLIGKGG